MKFIWLGLLAACLGISAARANVTYSYSGTYTEGAFTHPFDLDLTVTDSLAAGGNVSFIVTGSGNGCNPVSPTTCTITGDPTGFVSLSDNLLDNYAFPDIFGTLLANLTFTGGDPSGGVFSRGLYTDLSLSIGPDALAGSLQSDFGPCTGDSRTFCTVSAVRIPEPPVLALMFAGLFALFFIRRRFAR